jgi:glycosyltransferase involved in cell wall biosynthesis
MPPLVSVVMPVYNGAKYLRQALDSALAQIYAPLEVIAVDDGSTDESAEILEAYRPRVVTLRQANAGVSAARNAGIRAARGELIAFLDQDDWWLREKVSRQVALFSADDRLGLAHTAFEQFSTRQNAFVPTPYDTRHSPLLNGDCYEQLLLGNAIFNSTVMIRASVLARSGVFNTAMTGNTCQDYDLWLRVARHYPLAYLPDRLTVLRLHGEQGTWNRRAMLGDELRLLERTLGQEGLAATPVLRARVAQLLDELGVAHLDAGDVRQARRCFGRAFRLRWSRRAAVLYTLSLLPARGVDWLRRLRARRAKGQQAPEGVGVNG